MAEILCQHGLDERKSIAKVLGSAALRTSLVSGRARSFARSLPLAAFPNGFIHARSAI